MKIVAYYRVSTKKQGESGLGLEAQQEAVQAFTKEKIATIIRQYTEIETGKSANRPELQIVRKWGSWENWLHDTAIITGPNRHYILVGMTQHPRGDEYLEGLARAVDDLMLKGADAK